jgi:hypothetical protein
MPTNVNIDDTSGENRRWRRYPLTVPVRVEIEKPRPATLVDTRASHINDGGIAMYTNAELSVGTQAEIEFTPASFDFPLTLRGVVRNHAGNKYGVEFLATSAAENEHLTIFREILHSKLGRPDA